VTLKGRRRARQRRLAVHVVYLPFAALYHSCGRGRGHSEVNPCNGFLPCQRVR
jgi:hypothetical protein